MHHRHLDRICQKCLRRGRTSVEDAAIVVAQIRRTTINQPACSTAMTIDLTFVISMPPSERLCNLPVLSDVGKLQAESIRGKL